MIRISFAVFSLAVVATTTQPFCSDLGGGLGIPAHEAGRHAGDTLGAIAGRFGPTIKSENLSEIRPRLATASFVPSRVFDDREIWTGSSEDHRELGLEGRPDGDDYHLGTAVDPTDPSRPGQYRGRLELRALAEESAFEWRWRDELFLGAGTPGLVDRVAGVAFRARPRMPMRSRLGGRLLAALPRTRVSLGRLVRLVELRAHRLADGTTSISLTARVEPERIADEFPEYSRYLAKYAKPLRLNMQAYDMEGRRWWGIDVRDHTTTLRARVSGGSLAPLEGPVASEPERIRVSVDASTKAGLFRVGFNGLVADVQRVDRGSRQAFAAAFNEEPQWRIPLVFRPFLRSPLSRPFEGEGVLLSMSLESEPDGRFFLRRSFRMAVRESWITRRMGGVVSGALSEFREKAEQEADQFTGEVLEALRADVVALVDPAPAAVDP